MARPADDNESIAALLDGDRLNSLSQHSEPGSSMLDRHADNRPGLYRSTSRPHSTFSLSLSDLLTTIGSSSDHHRIRVDQAATIRNPIRVMPTDAGDVKPGAARGVSDEAEGSVVELASVSSTGELPLNPARVCPRILW